MVVTQQIDLFREPLRRDASAVNAIEYPRYRAELVAQIDLLNLLDETVRAALGAPSRIGPPRRELRDVPDELMPSPACRQEYSDGAGWRPGDDA